MNIIRSFPLRAVALALLFCTVAIAVASAPAGWFDMANCEMCAPMMAEKGLMENTKWESFSIATGMMNVMSVPSSYEAAFARAHEKCNALGEKLQKGETLKLCGSCTAMGQLLGQGAKMDQVNAGSSHVVLLTATEPSLVAKIQAYEKKNVEEMAKMKKTS